MVKLIEEQFCSSDRNELIGLCGSQNLFNGYCFPILDQDVVLYPKFSFVFNNVNLTLEPNFYLFSQNGFF